MNYNFIIDPKTGRKISVKSNKGKKTINNYLEQLGGSPCRQGNKIWNTVRALQPVHKSEYRWVDKKCPGIKIHGNCPNIDEYPSLKQANESEFLCNEGDSTYSVDKNQ